MSHDSPLPYNLLAWQPKGSVLSGLEHLVHMPHLWCSLFSELALLQPCTYAQSPASATPHVFPFSVLYLQAMGGQLKLEELCLEGSAEDILIVESFLSELIHLG